MPITKSAKKALRGSKRKKFVNDRRVKAMKEGIKSVEKAAKTKAKDVAATLSSAFAAIDKAAKKGVIKKNTAARRKAKLSRMVK